MSKEIGRQLTELRRSSAASPQNHKHELTDKEAIDEQREDDESEIVYYFRYVNGTSLPFLNRA